MFNLNISLHVFQDEDSDRGQSVDVIHLNGYVKSNKTACSNTITTEQDNISSESGVVCLEVTPPPQGEDSHSDTSHRSNNQYLSHDNTCQNRHERSSHSPSRSVSFSNTERKHRYPGEDEGENDSGVSPNEGENDSGVCPNCGGVSDFSSNSTTSNSMKSCSGRCVVGDNRDINDYYHIPSCSLSKLSSSQQFLSSSSSSSSTLVSSSTSSIESKCEQCFQLQTQCDSCGSRTSRSKGYVSSDSHSRSSRSNSVRTSPLSTVLENQSSTDSSSDVHSSSESNSRTTELGNCKKCTCNRQTINSQQPADWDDDNNSLISRGGERTGRLGPKQLDLNLNAVEITVNGTKHTDETIPEESTHTPNTGTSRKIHYGRRFCSGVVRTNPSKTPTEMAKTNQNC